MKYISIDLIKVNIIVSYAGHFRENNTWKLCKQKQLIVENVEHPEIVEHIETNVICYIYGGQICVTYMATYLVAIYVTYMATRYGSVPIWVFITWVYSHK